MGYRPKILSDGGSDMQIFTPEVRDKAVETACSNLVMAGQLREESREVIFFMAGLADKSDSELAEILIASRILLDEYLENCWSLN